MPVSKAQQKAVHKYVKANYDRMELTVPKGRKDEIKTHAETKGESVNGFINRAIDHEMERDSGTPPEIAGKPTETPQGAGVVSLPSEAVRTAQEGTETGKQPVPIDKAKAWENILGTFSDVGTVDLDKARCERLGIVYLSPDTLEAAQQAAEAAGEGLPDFVARAVATQAQRDEIGRKMEGGKANE